MGGILTRCGGLFQPHHTVDRWQQAVFPACSILLTACCKLPVSLLIAYCVLHTVCLWLLTILLVHLGAIDASCLQARVYADGRGRSGERFHARACF